jgi:hypothetical protein
LGFLVRDPPMARRQQLAVCSLLNWTRDLRYIAVLVFALREQNLATFGADLRLHDTRLAAALHGFDEFDRIERRAYDSEAKLIPGALEATSADKVVDVVSGLDDRHLARVGA